MKGPQSKGSAVRNNKNTYRQFREQVVSTSFASGRQGRTYNYGGERMSRSRSRTGRHHQFHMDDSTIETGRCVENNDYEPVTRSFID